MHRPRVMAAVAATVLLVAVSALPLSHGGAAGAATAQPPVHILRGALGIFSTGMDDLAEMLNARGIDAVSVNFTKWHEAFDETTSAYRVRRYPIVIVGHSWGADTALLMAYELGKQDIPVALLVLYDTTNSARVPANVRRVLNLRSSASIGRNVTVTGASYFAGSIDNIEVTDANHGQLDERDDIHEQTIKAIRRALRR